MNQTCQKFHLIFDFDGTLADSFDIAMQYYALLAEEFNFRKLNPIEMGHLKQLTSRELIRYLNIPIYKLPSVLKQARIHMSNEILNLPIFDKLHEILSELHQKHSLSILTSNALENVILWLEHHNMRHLFDSIYAKSSYFGKKRFLRKIIKNHQMDAKYTFYIGDETRDIEAAQQCGIHSIAVLWGFNTEETLKRFEPQYIAKTPRDLLEIIENHKANPNLDR